MIARLWVGQGARRARRPPPTHQFGRKSMRPSFGAFALALLALGKARYSTVPEMLKTSTERGLSFASAGTATPGHFAGEVLKLRTRSNMTHVPYNGAGPALNDLLGGHVDMFFSGFPAAVPHVKSGTLKLLAVSSARRSGVAPDVPTVAEASGIK